MEFGQWLVSDGLLWSPLTFAVLVGLAVILAWLAFVPVRPPSDVQDRLVDYAGEVDVIEETEISRSFFSRAVSPAVRSVLQLFGRIAPKRNIENTHQLLVYAGEPGRLGALDFYGIRFLFAVLLAAGYYFLLGRPLGLALGLRNTAIVALAGYFLPFLWLRQRARRRQHAILRALPDALDMLTVGVAAGLAFESAMLRVGEKWKNALTEEFARAVAEMRVGMPRNEALTRMADRCGVQELTTFVAILVQSSQLGVSIADVLHAQAAQMRIRRRQRAEELARQAGIKMLFPLLFFIFPAILVVILGPSIPAFQAFFASGVGGVGGGLP